MNKPRHIVITGANTGIGAATAIAIATQGTRVTLACRSPQKAEGVAAKVRELGAEADILELDLNDAAQAERAGKALAKTTEGIAILFNNAGVAGTRGTTKQGFELAFGVNYLGHFAFTLPLLAAVEQAGGRIVNVSSGNHLQAKRVDFGTVRQRTGSFTGLPEYAVSKLCNVLFTAELRRRYPNIQSVAVNPGRIASEMFRAVPSPFRTLLPMVLKMGTVETAAEIMLNAAKVPLNDNLYFHKFAQHPENKLARNEALATELWTFSERAVQQACEA